MQVSIIAVCPTCGGSNQHHPSGRILCQKGCTQRNGSLCALDRVIAKN